VYNFENREKVRDEEAVAKEELVKREQARKRDAEFRLEQLRTARGLASVIGVVEPNELEPKSGHLNLFEGIKIFDTIQILEKEEGGESDGFKKKKMKREEAAPKVVGPEDEKYRLGYGLVGKGVKLSWYLERQSNDGNCESGRDEGSVRGVKEEGMKSGKKKLEELREEWLNREKREKERELALMVEKSRRDGTGIRDRGFSRR
jgi:hypothetical protein